MKEILLPHNIKPYEDVMDAIKEKGKACAIQPTGTGKMFFAIKWLMENPSEPFVFLAPTNVILNSFVDKLVELFLPEYTEYVKQLSTKETLAFVNKGLGLNLELMTYAKVNFMTDEEMREMSVKRVVLDEFHHLGADKWGSSVDRFLEIHSDTQILGLTATPIRPSDGKDMVEYLFDGEIDSEITLKECFENGILKTPTLINGIYSFEEEMLSIEKSLKNKNLSPQKRKEVEKKLKQAKALIGKSHHGIRGIFEENLKPYERENGKLDVKLIVFCNDIEDRHRKMDECKSWFKRGTKIKKYSITSEEDKETVAKVVRNFEEDDAKCIKLIFVVDMLNEGLHIDGVDGVVMLRSTESQIVFLQQLGRALSVSSNSKNAPIVFDLTNNIEVLSEDIEEVEKTGLTFKRGIREEKGVLENTIFNIQAEIIDIIEYLKSVTYDFNDKIAPLVEYYKEHGTIGDIIVNKWDELGKLIHNLRNDLHRGRLKEEQIKVLDNMGMVWRVETKDWFTPFFEKLALYKEQHGNFNGVTTDPVIGNLVVSIRQAQRGKNGRKLTPDMVNKLNSIGFPWSVGYKNWFDPFYEKLVVYKKKRGSFEGLSMDPEIGQTAGRLRSAYRGKGHLKLTQEMIDKLNAIGFTWEVDLKGIKRNWFDPFYEKLIEYKKEHGDFVGLRSDKKIGNTVATIRMAYHNKGTLKLTEEMIDRLNEIDFIWEVEREDWFTPFLEKLIAYKAKHGSFDKISTDNEIGEKVRSVRKARKGKCSYKLTDGMIVKLNAIGFPWEVEKEDWFTPFCKYLIEYQKYNGSFAGVSNDKQIGRRVAGVRQAYKGKGNIRLTKEMIDQLNEIGFPWVVEKVDWFPQVFEDIKLYKETHGSFIGVTNDPSIGRTVIAIRQAYKGKGTTKLTNEMIEQLNEIGFIWEARPKKVQEELSI